MNEKRPDPEALLERANAEELRQKRGRLKIFFGASAGVGKTYAMLEAAKARKAEGADVVIGVVETHGRKETEALVGGLEILAPKLVDYRGATLKEFDLAGALARKPRIILIDELAHTNAAGSKNTKRYQDVAELLDAGIDVYTTVNVQHLESLNDVVAQITHVQVRETIPDAVVEQADEIELIDLPPDDLLRRLKEGKVYVASQAERAAANFFRKGNLIALRELALRCTAERVNRQVQSYREEQSIKSMWPTADRILVCVSSSPLSERLVRAGRRMAAGLGAEWFAVSVETPAQVNMPERDRQQLKHNLGLAAQLGAEVLTLQGASMVGEILLYAARRNITKIIVGKPTRSRWLDRLFGSPVDDLIRQSGDVDVYVIKGDAEAAAQIRRLPENHPVPGTDYAWAMATVALSTALCWPMFHQYHFERSNLIMLYLLGVVVIAARLGLGPAILTSVLGVAAFDFFYVEPFYTFAVRDSQFFVTFLVMLTVSIVISSLTSRIQRQAGVASVRERRTAALYSMTRQLSSTRGMERLLQIAVQHVSEVFESDVVGLMPDADGRLLVRAGNERFPFSPRERSVAQWVFDLARPAGMGTDTLPAAEAMYVPLVATRGPVGVLGVHPARPSRLLTADQIQLLEAFASQAALAIECDRLADEAQKAQVEAETEKSRSTLLSSVSHDLRTPLASITGASSSLLEENRLPEHARRELLETIHEESARMTRLVANLLEMTKLEAGTKMKKEWCPLEEVVGGALTRLEKNLRDHPVNVKLAPDLPLVPQDVILMEQVFTNLLENVVKYTPPGTAVDISASVENNEVHVDVCDNGPGLQSGDEKKIFDKFYRGKSASGARGAGLGLAICRAIVEAHGGKIWAENRAGGGAAFRFTLPLKGEKPVTEQLPEVQVS